MGFKIKKLFRRKKSKKPASSDNGASSTKSNASAGARTCTGTDKESHVGSGNSIGSTTINTSINARSGRNGSYRNSRKAKPVHSSQSRQLAGSSIPRASGSTSTHGDSLRGESQDFIISTHHENNANSPRATGSMQATATVGVARQSTTSTAIMTTTTTATATAMAVANGSKRAAKSSKIHPIMEDHAQGNGNDNDNDTASIDGDSTASLSQWSAGTPYPFQSNGGTVQRVEGMKNGFAVPVSTIVTLSGAFPTRQKASASAARHTYSVSNDSGFPRLGLDHIQEISWRLRTSHGGHCQHGHRSQEGTSKQQPMYATSLNAPNTTFDWQIEVTVVGNDGQNAVDNMPGDNGASSSNVQIYDIHQHIVCKGEHRSLALSRELVAQKDQMIVSADSAAAANGDGQEASARLLPLRLYLPEHYAAVMPALLDYCYAPFGSGYDGTALNFRKGVTTPEAMHLHGLAEYLEVPTLRKEIEEFFSKDV